MMPEAFSCILDYNTFSDYTYKEPLTTRPIRITKNYSHVQIPNSVHPAAGRRRTSSVVGQKLRESKWFKNDELKVFCAVVESGFVVEKRQEKIENTHYGIVLWDTGYEKSKNPDHLQIYTLSGENGKTKVVALKLDDFWPQGTTIRINNKNDKTETPLEETVIRHQISYAQHSKRKWHNSEHFTYFCRYGPVENSKRIMDHLKWNTGSLFQKIKSLSIK